MQKNLTPRLVTNVLISSQHLFTIILERVFASLLRLQLNSCSLSLTHFSDYISEEVSYLPSTFICLELTNQVF